MKERQGKRAGENAPMGLIYGFFLVHMGLFGLSGFLIAYADNAPDVGFLYMHGGIAIVVYLVFYLAIFGREQVGWMFANAGIGLFGIWTEIDWLLWLFGKDAADYAWYVHVIPFVYYVLYTFLIWQMVLDFTRARADEARRRRVRTTYVVISLAIYLTLWLL